MGGVQARRVEPAAALRASVDSYSFSATTRLIVPSAGLQRLDLGSQTDAVINSFDIRGSNQILYMNAMLNLSPRSGVPESATLA